MEKEKITDINIIADELAKKLKELNNEYELKQIMFTYTNSCGYSRNIIADVQKF